MAIAADSVDEMGKLAPKLPGLTLLTDPQLATSAAFGLREPGAESPSPGTFVIDRGGSVRWKKIGDAHGDWPTYADVAGAL